MSTKIKILIGILGVIILGVGGYFYFIWTPISEGSCKLDADCKFTCGCQCIPKTKICPSLILCRPSVCSAACRCLNGKCTSWSEVYEEALRTKNIDLCKEIKHSACKDYCLAGLSKKEKIEKTTDWETYTETGYWGNKCSIKYPPDWEVRYEESINVHYLTPKEKRIPEDVWVTINCFPKEKGYTDQKGKDLLPLCSSGKFSLANTEKFEGIYSKEFCTLSEDGSQVGTAIFQVRGGRQRMDYYIPDKEFEPEFNVFNQMLSTFRFLE
jgi:hypothetical protein